MALSRDNIELLYLWLEFSQTKVPPGSLDRIGKAHTEKWEIVYKEPYGRCIVAKQNIKEGETLFYDYPIVTGPKQNCGYLCLGCYKQLDENPEYVCSRCGMPLCDAECQSKGYHPLECKAFSEGGYKVNLEDFGAENPLYESILPLRCLKLKDGADKKWATLMALESHDDLRRGSELWNIEQVNVCDFLRKKVKLKEDDAMIHSITGVLDINCHEVKSCVPGTRLECRVRGLYPLCAMMSHDCYSNTHHTFADDMVMVMVASRDISKGEQITGTYTHLLSGTTERRKHLRYGKFFDCVCRRCSDPTELGTFFSALRCTRPGCDGDVLCKDPLHPQNKADYACSKCRHEVPVSMVSRLTNLVYYELQSVGNGDPDSLEAIFNKYKRLLHPDHFHLVGIKHSLSQLYGRVPGYLIGDMSEQQMERKVECCRDLLKIIDVIDPGISRLRGLTKYELHAPLLVRANRHFQSALLTRREFLERLTEALNLLQGASHCLMFEPPSSYEGEVCKIARSSADELQQWIATVRHLPDANFLPEPCEKPPGGLAGDDLTLAALLRELESY